MGRPRIPDAIGSCPATGKRQYESESVARRAIRWLKRYGNGSTRARYAYQCRHCLEWHLSKQRPHHTP